MFFFPDCIVVASSHSITFVPRHCSQHNLLQNQNRKSMWIFWTMPYCTTLTVSFCFIICCRTLAPTLSPTLSPTLRDPWVFLACHGVLYLWWFCRLLLFYWNAMNHRTLSPTLSPTSSPTLAPTLNPTIMVSQYASKLMTDISLHFCTHHWSFFSTQQPTLFPTASPTISPTLYPTFSVSITCDIYCKHY